MIKLIIFDFSNVCFNLEEDPFVEKFAKKHKLDPKKFDEEYQQLVQKAEVDEIGGKQIWEVLLQKYHLNGNPSTIIEEMMNTKIAYPEILELAKSLRQNYKTAYFTNYSKDYWDPIARKFDLKPYFDFGIVSYQIQSRKPAPKGFLVILKQFKVKPEEAVFIDDSSRNVVEAGKLGIHTILFKDKKQIQQELRRLGAK